MIKDRNGKPVSPVVMFNNWICAVLTVIFSLLPLPRALGTQPAVRPSPRMIVAVDTLQTRGRIRRFNRPEVENGLTGLLIEALIDSGRFLVVERTALSEIMTEQRIQRGSPLFPQHAAKGGRMLGAQAMILGTVIEFEPSSIGEEYKLGTLSDQFNLGMDLRLRLKYMKATVEVQVRIIDTTTGHILDTHTGRGRSGTSGVTIDAYQPDMSFGSDLFFRRPIGTATRRAVSRLVRHIVDATGQITWQARVMEIIGGKVYVNVGSLHNIRRGDTFSVHRETQELTDPVTGAVVDRLQKFVARIRIEAVERRYAVAEMLEGEMPIRGDLVKLP